MTDVITEVEIPLEVNRPDAQKPTIELNKSTEHEPLASIQKQWEEIKDNSTTEQRRRIIAELKNLTPKKEPPHGGMHLNPKLYEEKITNSNQ